MFRHKTNGAAKGTQLHHGMKDKDRQACRTWRVLEERLLVFTYFREGRGARVGNDFLTKFRFDIFQQLSLLLNII